MNPTASPAAPVSRYLRCAGRELHCMEWGAHLPAGSPVLLAWHGLARTGRDMDDIAEHLSTRADRPYRVLCPDTIGRGLSQWSPKPEQEYCLAFYAQLAAALLDGLGIEAVDWLGTSMGGAIGVVAADGVLRDRIGRLVLNDSGPELAAGAIARIRSYAGSPSAFDTVTELEQYFRTVYRPYGWLSDAQWRRLTETSIRRLSDGRVTPHYDPAMVMQFTHHADDYARWPEWDRLRLPVLCLRGESSDLLLPESAEAMRHRGPCAEVVTVAGCGHAPALNTPEQCALVARFLDA